MQSRNYFKGDFSMIHKRLLTPASVTALLTFVLAFAFVQLWETPLQGLMNEIFALAIYGLLIASYLLRIALVFLGVFAVYRILRERMNGQEHKQMEVELGLK
jgi:lysylphosphatidylglycerol synthetase-like protein (DUF2156 family)